MREESRAGIAASPPAETGAVSSTLKKKKRKRSGPL